MKKTFIFIYIFNLIKINPVKTIAIILLFIIFPFLNSLKDIKNIDKIDYQYEKDGQYFYVTKEIYKSDMIYGIQSFEKVPNIKNGYLITYSWNGSNILIWLGFLVLCVFPIVCIFTSDSDISFEFDYVFWSTISYYITCELEEGVYYYFYGDRFLGKSNKSLQNEYKYLSRAFRISNFSNIRNCPVWKTKSQNRNNKIEELGLN